MYLGTDTDLRMRGYGEMGIMGLGGENFISVFYLQSIFFFNKKNEVLKVCYAICILLFYFFCSGCDFTTNQYSRLETHLKRQVGRYFG